MVYCNLLSNTENTVTYMYGAYEDDITGIFKVDLKDKSLEIIKEPEKKNYVFIRHIQYAIKKHYSGFLKGIFPDKIIYDNY